MVPSFLPPGIAADEGAVHPKASESTIFASGQSMEASIQLIPKNIPQDCRRAQVFLFHGERWEEGGAECKRPSLHGRELGHLECGTFAH